MDLSSILVIWVLIILVVLGYKLFKYLERNNQYDNTISIKTYSEIYQKATQILINRKGGYVFNSENIVDILFFLENGLFVRTRVEKEKEILNSIKNDKELKRQYDLLFNEELRSKLRCGAGKWTYNEIKNEIKINFALGEDIIRCKLKKNGHLSANNFVINNGIVIKKNVFEYMPTSEIFCWYANIPNLDKNGKRYIIS